MEIRLLESFLAIAEAGSVTRAAEVLHITQPALSRQLTTLEGELGCPLFTRGKRRMELTEQGLLLQRRAAEILSLVALTEDELSDQSAELEGRVSIGAGELSSAAVVTSLVAEFAALHPRVTFDFFTGVSDQVTGRLERGLLDFGLLMQPVDALRYEVLRLPVHEQWVAVVRAEDPLAGKEGVAAADLAKRPLVLPVRVGPRSLLAEWFGEAFEGLNARYTVNLGGMAARVVEQGLSVFVGVAGCVEHWDRARFAVLPLDPPLLSSTALAWKRGMAHTAAVEAFIAFSRDRLTPRR